MFFWDFWFWLFAARDQKPGAVGGLQDTTSGSVPGQRQQLGEKEQRSALPPRSKTRRRGRSAGHLKGNDPDQRLRLGGWDSNPPASPNSGTRAQLMGSRFFGFVESEKQKWGTFFSRGKEHGGVIQRFLCMSIRCTENAKAVARGSSAAPAYKQRRGGIQRLQCTISVHGTPSARSAEVSAKGSGARLCGHICAWNSEP